MAAINQFVFNLFSFNVKVLKHLLICRRPANVSAGSRQRFDLAILQFVNLVFNNCQAVDQGVRCRPAYIPHEALNDKHSDEDARQDDRSLLKPLESWPSRQSSPWRAFGRILNDVRQWMHKESGSTTGAFGTFADCRVGRAKPLSAFGAKDFNHRAFRVVITAMMHPSFIRINRPGRTTIERTLWERRQSRFLRRFPTRADSCDLRLR